LLLTGALGFGGMWFAESAYTFVALMLPVGIAWSSIMAMPYVMLAAAVPEDRMGVYMGIFNMFIVIPQILSMLLVPQIYNPLLLGDPRNALLLAAVLLVFAAISNRWVKLPKNADVQP
jgi:maltose/moltooligosaccharide transporter